MACKICIIGAGSAVFSINLVKDICINKNFRGSTVTLMDINEDRLKEIYGLCGRYAEEMEADITVEKTMDRREAMQGADFVLNVALDYGHDRFKQGVRVAEKNGYHFGGSLHIVHDEGFFINFHQLKLMESILLDMLEICPKAYYILVANPVQAGVTYLQRKYKNAKIIGMCHGFNGIYNVTDAMGLVKEDVSFEIAGVNHFIWLTSFRYKGADGYRLLDDWLENGYVDFAKNIRKSSMLGKKPIDLYRRFGLFPIGDTANPGGGAWGWEYHSDKETEEMYGEDPKGWYDGYFTLCDRHIAQIRAAVEDKTVKVSDVFSSLPSSEPMIPLIEGLAFDVENKVIVNILNDGGYMKGMPQDYEVEIAAIVNKNGVKPIHNNGLPKPIMSHLLRDRVASVETELAAFETHRKDYLLDLILMDPWTSSRQQAENLLQDIFNMPCNADMKMYYR